MNNIKKVMKMNYPDGANMALVLEDSKSETEEFYIVNFDDFTEVKFNCVTEAIEKAKALTAYCTAESGEKCSSMEVVYIERENDLDNTVQVVATVKFNEEEYTWEIVK